MTEQLFTLSISYEARPEPVEVHSTDEAVLRQMGQDHHAAAQSKPEMALRDPQGSTVATMDIWNPSWLPVER